MRKLAPLFLRRRADAEPLPVPAGAYYASNEDGKQRAGRPHYERQRDDRAGSRADAAFARRAYAPTATSRLIDDILGGAYYSSEDVGDSQMQFVTVESKNGNTFYLVIDHSTGDVYFLNLVDEADLPSTAGETKATRSSAIAPSSAPPEKWTPTVRYCRTDLNECVGAEPRTDDPNPPKRP